MNRTIRDLPAVRAVLERHACAQDLDSYAVLARFGGAKATVTSQNVNEDTLFDMASCGKALVTTPLVLQAVSRGFLRLDQTLPDFFSDVPADIRGVTVTHLLTHTSGICRSQLTAPQTDDRRGEFLRQIFAAPRAFAPGSDYKYSCHGMILLGYILETVYGKSLEDVFRENLSEPLGYTRSRFNVDFGEENIAVSYHWDAPEPYPFARPWDDENIRVLGTSAGSGGQFFSLSDIDKYITALLKKDERLYRKDLFDRAERDHTPDFAEGRGLGFWLADRRFPEAAALFPAGTFGHIGSTGTSFFLNRQADGAVVILTNMRRFVNRGGVSYDDYMRRFFALRQEIYAAVKEDGACFSDR